MMRYDLTISRCSLLLTDEVVGVSGVELWCVGNGLERLKEHGKPSQLVRSATVKHHWSTAEQTARVVRSLRYLHTPRYL